MAKRIKAVNPFTNTGWKGQSCPNPVPRPCPHGVNIAEYSVRNTTLCQEQAGQIIPADITIYEGSFFYLCGPYSTRRFFLLKQAAGVEGISHPNKIKIGKILA